MGAIQSAVARLGTGTLMRGRLRLVQAAVALVILAAAIPAAAAEGPAFDLAGPALRITVEHQGVRLPIAKVANLVEGDLLTIRADPSAAQTTPYLLIAAFLRGATDPPPREWFTRDETWTARGLAGVTVRVPAGARQALIFLAPRTSGDFTTVTGAVRGRPGAFVRASQDLRQASLDRSRLITFLAALRRSEAQGPDALKTASPLLARTLDLKLNADCLQRAPELQAACLLQGRDALVLNDGHSRSLVEALTGGPASDLALHLSAAPAAGYGASSPYIGAVVDIARMLDALRTAQFQYIPALADMQDDRLSLMLNTAPSFQNPRSVLVVALPPVDAPRPPMLRAVDPGESFCLASRDLVLPMTGAPLVYSTALAHDLVLHAFSPEGGGVDVPVTADAARGGLVASQGVQAAAALHGALAGTLRGSWGFTRFEGPVLLLQGPRGEPWRLADADGAVVGREETIRLEGPSACVKGVRLQLGSDPPREVAWKAAGAGAVTVTAPLADAQPGSAVVLVEQYGAAAPQSTPVKLFSQAAHLDGFAFHVGDGFGVLTGTRLDEVAGLSFAELDFSPGALVTVNGRDELTLTAGDAPAAARLKSGRSATARVTLKDGRTLRIPSVVGGTRLQAAVVSMSQDGHGEGGPLKLDGGAIPLGSRLTFSARTEGGLALEDAPAVEVALPDAPSVTLTTTHGLTRLDAGMLVARLDTQLAFGGSHHGMLRFRVVQGGAAGDWRSLAVLVRTPVLRRLRCPEAVARSCTLEGDDLFLMDAVSNDPAFATSRAVPAGYTEHQLAVPRPRPDGRLFVRLHDDPSRPATLTMSISAP